MKVVPTILDSIGSLPHLYEGCANNSIGSTFYGESIKSKSCCYAICYCILYCLSCAALFAQYEHLVLSHSAMIALGGVLHFDVFKKRVKQGIAWHNHWIYSQ